MMGQVVRTRKLANALQVCFDERIAFCGSPDVFVGCVAICHALIEAGIVVTGIALEDLLTQLLANFSMVFDDVGLPAA